MELLGQQLAPEIVEIDRRTERGGPQLGLDQQALAPPVPQLGPQLAGERAAVRLEVELTAPHRDGRAMRRLVLDRVEHLRRSPHLQREARVDRGQAARPFEHLTRRSPTPVAVAEGHQRHAAPPVLLEVADREGNFVRGDLGVVRVDRREVREHPCPVEALPPERVVGEDVLLVPRQLLRDEAGHPTLCEHLRQARGIAEHVGDPHLVAAAAETLLEVALAVHDLTDEALPRRQVHVRLDPHPADRDPLPALDALDDLREQLGMTLLHPGVLLGLRAREPVLGVVVHQRHRRGEGAGALAHGLAQRPQPGRVDVGVAGGDDPVGALRRRTLGQPRRQQTAGTDDVGQRVEGGHDGAHQAGTTGIVEVQRTHVSVEHLDVVGERFCLVVVEDDLGPPERVEPAVAGGREPSQRRRPELREHRVGGSLDEEVGTPAGDDVGRQPVVGAARMDALHRASTPVAVDGDDQPFGLEARSPRVEPEVDHGLHATVAPRRRDLAREPEPRGLPRSPPPIARSDAGSRAVGPVGRGGGQRPAVDVGQWQHALPQLTGDPLLEQLPIVEHAPSLDVHLSPRGQTPM